MTWEEREHCPICGRSCQHGWHCAWCGKALSYVVHPDGFGRWHNAESGTRHYDECEQWQHASQTSGAVPASTLYGGSDIGVTPPQYAA